MTLDDLKKWKRKAKSLYVTKRYKEAGEEEEEILSDFRLLDQNIFPTSIQLSSLTFIGKKKGFLEKCSGKGS